MTAVSQSLVGAEHWVTKQHSTGPIRLFAWEKYDASFEGQFTGTALLVHGSSMASTPSFDLQVPGHGDDHSLMAFLARHGFDVWCFDCEGYGRSEKSRDSKFLVSDGADDAAAVADYIRERRGNVQLQIFGVSSGALRAAMLAERRPELVQRMILDAFVWTGAGSPTLAERRKRLPQFLETNRRPIDPAFVRSIFTRDHPGTADDEVIEAFAAAVLALDDSVPNGTYIDMCQNLPLVEPRNLDAPTMIMRGEHDGIAAFEDLVEFFKLLPNPDKQFVVLPGSAHSSLHEKNFRTVFHLILGFFTQPAPVYQG
ncbi:MAG TPA: alpha/beta fold hydrolase [Dehalococcoidia bacterium]|nr:alpha/beta fold hydrolase [Dehalococcoidia bacterium]